LLFALVLWLLFSGRWGSYVGYRDRGLLLTDVALVVSAAALVATNSVSSLLARLRRPPLLITLCAALVGLAVVRLAFSDGSPLVMLRDFAPYGYAGVALLVFLSPRAGCEHSATLVISVLTLHTLSAANSVWSIVPISSLPVLGGNPILTMRPDYDSAVCGVTIAAALYVAIYARPSKLVLMLLLLLAVVSGLVVLEQPSRSGLLAALATTAVLVAVPAWGRLMLRPLALVAVGAALVGTTVAVLLFTTPGERLADGLTGAGGAAGTVDARQTAYERVIDYNLETTSRAVFGVGFGPDFLKESGADVPLAGTDYEGVRSPHNYLLGTWSRLGVLGLALSAAVMALGVIVTVRTLRSFPTVAEVVASGCLIGLPIVAQFGVVLEAPFGAVVYFWAAGFLCRQLARGEPIGDVVISRQVDAVVPAAPGKRRR
jgi:hypothetical protein